MEKQSRSEKTQQRILGAATCEFATYGVAGARVDRIAKNAEANKSLIYSYYGSKEQLFYSVLRHNLAEVYKKVSFNVDDLAEYAANLFDFAMEHPNLMKLVMWNGLEPIKLWPLDDELSLRAQVNIIKEKQISGLIGSTFSAEYLLTYILTMASAWTAANPFGNSIMPDSEMHIKSLRKSIYDSVRTLIAIP